MSPLIHSKSLEMIRPWQTALVRLQETTQWEGGKVYVEDQCHWHSLTHREGIMMKKRRRRMMWWWAWRDGDIERRCRS
jgi:hypothetical protein